jgi:hypothetical protein
MLKFQTKFMNLCRETFYSIKFFSQLFLEIKKPTRPNLVGKQRGVLYVHTILLAHQIFIATKKWLAWNRRSCLEFGNTGAKKKPLGNLYPGAMH